MELVEGPRYDKPEAKAFWQPVTEGIREILKKRGLADRWHLGCASDNKPSKEVALFWKDVAPEARWVHQGHGLDGQYYGVPLGYNTTVWRARRAVDPAVARTFGWRNKQVVCLFHRDIWRVEPDSLALVGRVLCEEQIQGAQHGFGRMSADFWPCLKDAKGQLAYSISSRYPESSWAQCNIRMTPYLVPGPDGALSTVRYELIIEGMQECEARIFVQEALLDAAKRAKLGEQRARQLQDLLDERTRVLLWGSYAAGWQDRSEKLFAAAAEVAAALGK